MVPSSRTMPLRAPLRSAGMTRPNAQEALQEATKARAALQQAATPRQAPARAAAPAQAPMRAAPQAQARPVAAPAPAQAPVRPMMQAPAAGPQAASPMSQAQAYAAAAQKLAQPAPQATRAPAYPNPEWAPRAITPMAVNLPQGFTMPGPVAPGGNILASTAAPGTDMTAEYEAQYGTPEQQQAKQNAALAQQESGIFAEQDMPGAQAPPPGVDPETWNRYLDIYGQDFAAMSPEEQAAFIAQEETDFAGDVASDGAYTAKLEGANWPDDANPGPGWKLENGRWVEVDLPPGVSADDPNWAWDVETKSWTYTNKPGINADEVGRRLETILDTPSDEFGVSDEIIDEQKGQAWKQAELTNQQVANMLGSRGIGASGLAGLGFGNVLTETQKQVQGIDFDNAQLGIEERLNMLRTLAGMRGTELSEENRRAIAEMDEKLQRDLEEGRQASEDKGDSWQIIDNVANIYANEAPKGWGAGQAEAFARFMAANGGDWSGAKFSTQGEQLYFEGGSSSGPETPGAGTSGLGGYAPGWEPGDPLNGFRPRTEGDNGFLGATGTYEEYVAYEESRGYTPRSYEEWQKYGAKGQSIDGATMGRDDSRDSGEAQSDYSSREAQDWQEF